MTASYTGVAGATFLKLKEYLVRQDLLANTLNLFCDGANLLTKASGVDFVDWLTWLTSLSSIRRVLLQRE